MQNKGYSSNLATSGWINLDARPRRRRGERVEGSKDRPGARAWRQRRRDDRHVKERKCDFRVCSSWSESQALGALSSGNRVFRGAASALGRPDGGCCLWPREKVKGGLETEYNNWWPCKGSSGHRISESTMKLEFRLHKTRWDLDLHGIYGWCVPNCYPYPPHVSPGYNPESSREYYTHPEARVRIL
jgi:hypothetical protein